MSRHGRSSGAVVAVVGLAALAGCGGSLPGLDPDELFDWHFGAIALNPDTYAIAIAVNLGTQESADDKAVQTCASAACQVVLRFSGRGVCGAIARGSNWTHGTGAAHTLADAEALAVQQCQSRGGRDCRADLSDCNG